MRACRWLLVAAIAATAVTLPLVATAHQMTLRDGNDSRGALDIRLVKKSGVVKPVWKVISGSRWTAKRVQDHGYVLVYADTFGNERSDYYALIGSDGLRLKGTLFRDRARKPDRKVSALDVWRRNRRSVSVRVPLRKMIVPERRDHFNWFVRTLMTSPKCKPICFDRAPNRAAVEEPLKPAPSPSPSPDH